MEYDGKPIAQEGKAPNLQKRQFQELRKVEGTSVENFDLGSENGKEIKQELDDDIFNLDDDEIEDLKNFPAEQKKSKYEEREVREEHDDGFGNLNLVGKNLPDNLNEQKTPKLGESLTIELEEKVCNSFQTLPEGWIQVTHNSGMPLFLHKQSRVCSDSRPYLLGSGSIREHIVALNALPSLNCRRVLEEEVTENENVSNEFNAESAATSSQGAFTALNSTEWRQFAAVSSSTNDNVAATCTGEDFTTQENDAPKKDCKGLSVLFRERKPQEKTTVMQHNKPNSAILKKLRTDMKKLSEKKK